MTAAEPSLWIQTDYKYFRKQLHFNPNWFTPKKLVIGLPVDIFVSFLVIGLPVDIFVTFKLQIRSII